MLKLYYMPDTCALASHVALEQAGAKYEAVRVVSAAFDLIERGMLKGPWVLGETYSICDPYLFTLAQWVEADGVDTAKLPRVMDHRRRVAELPAVRKALAAERG